MNPSYQIGVVHDSKRYRFKMVKILFPENDNEKSRKKGMTKETNPERNLNTQID